MIASIDFETRSAVDLRASGLYKYMESPTSKALCLAWRIGDGAVQGWWPGQPDPRSLLDHVAAGGRVIAHNNAFDRMCWNTLAPAHWPRLAIEQSDCTMARAAVMTLPQSLEQAGAVVGAMIQKDKEGSAVMKRLCAPIHVGECAHCGGVGIDCPHCIDGTEYTFEEDAALHARNLSYCKQDVASEREIDRRLPQLSVGERAVWVLDQRINSRGVAIDAPLVQKAFAAVMLAVGRADERMEQVTGGAVTRATQTARLLDWLDKRGIKADSLNKAAHAELLVWSDLNEDPAAREAIELRREAGKSSTAKYTALLNQACTDGRVRGSLRYHGASTGRWAGAGIQPQNFPRAGNIEQVKAALDILRGARSAEAAVDGIQLEVGQPLAILSRCLRAMLIAGPGTTFMGGDYSNIEGRVNAWLAGEDWKTTAFREFDVGVGADLYVRAYAAAFGIDESAVDDHQRQIGKVMELSMGYQGGWRAFDKMGANYGVSVGKERGEQLKKAWRSAHPNIEASWYELQDAALEAVRYKGVSVPALGGKVTYRVASGALWCLLPSGRPLCYVSPRIAEGMAPNDETGEMEPTGRPQVAFMGTDSVTKKWSMQRLYGGLQCENIVQATARDILVHGMHLLEKGGYPTVLTVHDENLNEVLLGHGSLGDYTARMLNKADWYSDLPVAVKTWEGPRYGLDK